MKSKCAAQESDQRSFVLIQVQGEEAFGSISRCAEQMNIAGASPTALDTFESARLG